MNDATSVPQTIDTQIAGGFLTVDTGHLDYDPEQKCIIIDFPGGDVILLPHEARNLAEAINSTIDREEGPSIADLTDDQVDGFACVVCGTEDASMVPAGSGPRGQLFQCAEHKTEPTIVDVVECADILGFEPGELLAAIEPLLLAQSESRTLRRPAEVDDRLRELDD